MDQTDEKLRVYTFIVLALLLVFSIMKFLFTGKLDSFSLILILATVVLMLILVRISDLSSVNILNNINASFERRLNQTDKRVEETKAELDETKDRVEKLFLATMSTPMYNNLKKLATPPFGDYIMQTGLKRELYHLRDIGYVLITQQCKGSISEIPQVGEDLSIYVTVTDSGKEFIEEKDKIFK